MPKNEYKPDNENDPEILNGVIKDMMEAMGHLQSELEEQTQISKFLKETVFKELSISRQLKSELDKVRGENEHLRKAAKI